MENFRFTKMEGAGNDYVYVNLFEETLSKPQEVAVAVSHRRYGVGSDGLVLIAPSENNDFRMIMYNADGSESEMCGNAIRCVGKYVYEHGMTDKKRLSIETLAGVKQLELIVDDSNQVQSVTVSMGVPILRAELIPSKLQQQQVVNQVFNFNQFYLEGTLVSMGNPHFVTYVADVNKTPVAEMGPAIENSCYFPNRINVEFVQVVSDNEVIQRTWERGSGETWACGTGASAVAVAGVLTGNTGHEVLIHLKGGDLLIRWPGPGLPVEMTGPAREVYTGIWQQEL